jgi:multimeric flavodoxin WrbA
MKLLGIHGSPRKEGNTSLLLRELLKGASEKGAKTTEIFISDLHIRPCIADYSCAKTGECILKDDMQAIYKQLIEHDHIVVAAPIFFYNVNAQTKALIDRSQMFWARKYMLKQPIATDEVKRRGIFISVGATKGSKLFEGTLLTMKYYFDTLDAQFFKSLLYKNIDDQGDILNYPDAMKESYSLGQTLVTL